MITLIIYNDLLGGLKIITNNMFLNNLLPIIRF